VAGGWSAVIGVVLLLVAAVGVVVQLKDALNTIFEVTEPKNPGAAWYVKVYGGAFTGILALAVVAHQGLSGVSRCSRDDPCYDERL
jgi:uncharacterized BrkB/YihY/UPF0761 family membrane protein